MPRIACYDGRETVGLREDRAPIWRGMSPAFVNWGLSHVYVFPAEAELPELLSIAGAEHCADLADHDGGADRSRDVFEHRGLELVVLCVGDGHALVGRLQPQPVR